jgi:hypothetical protein
MEKTSMKRSRKSWLSSLALVAVILTVTATGALAQPFDEPAESRGVGLVSPADAHVGRHTVEFLKDCGEGETCRNTPIPVLEDRIEDGLGSASPEQIPGRYRVEFSKYCGEGETCRDRSIPVPEARGADGLSSALQNSTIIIAKNAEPADGTDFAFSSELGDFTLDDASPDDGDAVVDSKLFEVTPLVSQPFIEQAPLFWDLNSIVCVYSSGDTIVTAIRDNGSLIGVTIAPAPEDEVTCTFNNQRTTVSSITIAKNAEPADGTDFAFGSDLGAFTLDDASPDDGDAVVDSKLFEVTPLVSQPFIEQAPLFWDLNSIVCVYSSVDTIVTPIRDNGSLLGVTVTPAPEDEITCTFNNQKGPVNSVYLPFVSKNYLSP